MTTTIKYDLRIRILHWTMAALILGMIAAGWYMTGLEREDPLRATLYGLHKSFGVLLLILFFLRLMARVTSYVPPLPEGLKSWEKKAAHGGHHLLYLLMLAVPLSGYIMSDAGGHGVAMFGLDMPDVFPGKQPNIAGPAHTFHGYAPYVMLAVIALHIAGALRHRLFDRPENDVLKRML